jgi:hypothetical protein
MLVKSPSYDQIKFYSSNYGDIGYITSALSVYHTVHAYG